MGNLLEKFLKLEDLKKVPDKEIFADSQDEKILPEDITPGDNDQKVSALKLSKKVPKIDSGSKNRIEDFGPTTGEIDRKIIEFDLRIEKKFNEFNERQLKLIKTGLKHELSLDNVRRYIKTHHKKTKMYKLADYFSDADLSEIEEMLMFLHSTGEIRRDKNNFWYLTKSKGE